MTKYTPNTLQKKLKDTVRVKISESCHLAVYGLQKPF